MHPSLPHLIALQSEDLKLAEVRAALSVLPGRLAETEKRIAAARQRLNAAREARTKSLTDRKKFELDVEQWKERVRKYKDQTAAVKSNEAYKALQHEIAMAEAEVAMAEDRLLERMMAGEEFEKQIKSADAELKQIEAAAEADRRVLSEEKARLEAQQAELAAARKVALAAVPEDLLDIYHRLAKRHGGIALSEVRNETCSMCRVMVRPHIFQKLRDAANENLFHCESCTRILYCLPESAAQSTAPATGQAREQSSGQ
jgi:predicted  nucleic acid-binding Zn-ribbon protein